MKIRRKVSQEFNAAHDESDSLRLKGYDGFNQHIVLEVPWHKYAFCEHIVRTGLSRHMEVRISRKFTTFKVVILEQIT